MMTLFLAVAAPEIAADGISVEAAVMLLLAGLLIYCIKAVADLHRRVDRLAADVRARPKPKPASTRGDALPPQLVAAIVAAVNETLGPGHTVTKIVSAAAHGSANWSLEGRREVFQSHRVR